jgi:hypothetical protein
MMNRAFNVLVYCTKNISPLQLNTQTYHTITHYEVLLLPIPNYNKIYRKSTGNTERLFTSLHKLYLLQINVGETQNSVATFIGNCSHPMPTHYVKNQMGYVEKPLKFLCKLKIYILFILECKWV